jgi:hypothetical protein
MISLLTCYDAAGENADPGDIPADAEAVLYPIDGIYRWTPETLARFPKAVQIPYTVEGNPDAYMFDLESGCCSPAEVARGLEQRRARSLASLVYCSVDFWGAYLDDLEGAGLVGPPSHWWVASYQKEAKPAPTELPTLGKRFRAVAFQYFSCETFDVSVIDLSTFPKNLGTEPARTGA